MRAEGRLLALLAVCAIALLWVVPFAWMAVASLRPGVPPDIDLEPHVHDAQGEQIEQGAALEPGHHHLAARGIGVEQRGYACHACTAVTKQRAAVAAPDPHLSRRSVGSGRQRTPGR